MDIDALHSALLSITVVSEKVRAAREMLLATGNAPARLGKFLCEVETDLQLLKPRSAANWYSVSVPTAGRRSWSRPISTASLIVRSADKFRTSKQRELRVGALWVTERTETISSLPRSRRGLR
ncbi:MAG: hypothetical protein DMF23_10855 [Verrucomicrobia bacterium]|nr:MAG: hypothetical protein DMF23_10855 [Verrucomicrobiota bacterium]